ncbi:geranylgeranyl reductase family protein [archaeon]|nr:geranylgeranyl reductase family protein [archaeon]
MQLKKNYDVIIVGAGPGGAMAARKCAQGGLDTLLLEKRQEIGAPKRCGEGISIPILLELGFKGNENFVMRKINGSIIIPPNKKEVLIDYSALGFNGAIVERKLFDKALCYKAADAGAKIIAKATVVNVLKKNEKIIGISVSIDGKIHNLYSKIVIAADGVESKIARMAGINTTNIAYNMDSGYQYEMAGIKIKDPNKIYLYFGNNIAPRGYIWIFPKGKTVANVGIGIAGHHDKTAKEYLDEWIETQPNIKKGSIIEVNAGGIPVGGFLKNMVLDNFMVVGDAAHQVNPAHGGGIGEAARAGTLAAKIAIKAIRSKNISKKFLEEYNQVWWAKYGNNLENIEKYRLLFEKLSDEDMNLITASINGNDILDISKGNGKTLIDTLIKHPKLFKLSRHIF